MPVCAARITLYAASSHSLKDKRQILRSLIDKIKHRFNVSIAELEDMDIHQRLVIGVACISNSDHQARRVLDEVIRFIEDHAEAEVVNIEDLQDVISG